MSQVAIRAAYLALAIAAAPLTAHAHGTMELPASRALTCFNEGAEQPKSGGCKAAKAVGGSQQFYDWNGVRQGNAGGNHRAVVPDGKLCSAGSAQFSGLDLARTDWPQTSIVPTPSGDYTFVWRATAHHATQYFKYYITRDGWDPTQPLRWSDLQEFASLPGSAATNDGQRYRMTVRLPQGKKGSHMIYSVWQRADSPEAFYACADVKFPRDGVPAPSFNWEELGPFVAAGDLAAGTKVTFRVMDAGGRDVARHTLDITAANGRASLWSYQLAQKVNAESHVFRIGELQTQNGVSSFVPQTSTEKNRVYHNKSYPGYQYALDKEVPSTAGQPAGGADHGGSHDGGSSWKEGKSYETGDVVTYQGRKYTCLQRHTAWSGAGWTPATTPALWGAMR